MGWLFLVLLVLLLVPMAKLIRQGLCSHSRVHWRLLTDSKAGFALGTIYICEDCAWEFTAAPVRSTIVGLRTTVT